MKRSGIMTKKKIIGFGVAVVLIVALLLVYNTFREKPVEGSKSITIEVINKAQESTMYEVQTDAEFFQQAMDEAEGLEYVGKDSSYGIMMEEVNGDVADYEADGSWWRVTVNGADCNYGVSEQPVEDGDAFQIIYTK